MTIPKPAAEISVLGYKINPLTKAELINHIELSIDQRERVYMTHINLHGMALLFESEDMLALSQCSRTVVTIDGTAVLWLARLLGNKLRAANRITSLDYINDLFALCVTKDWKVFYVGGTPEVLERGVAHFKAKFPTLEISGHDGYFDVSDFNLNSRQSELLNAINSCAPDIIIVGMGMPRQEEWVYSVRDRIGAPVIITIGAMLEYYTGSLPMPPRWLGPMGLEWLFRLVTAPKRLGHRYLVEPFILIGRLIRGAPGAHKESSGRSRAGPR